MHEVDLDESIDDPDELYLRWPQHNTPRIRNSISILDEDFESGEMELRTRGVLCCGHRR